MMRKFSLVIEGDADGYSAYVPELPSILVTGRSMDELATRAIEAIKVYWESIRTELPAASTLREIEVDLPV
jgi:predicted RNase H-like HicB family nuclease